jgi:hypothetical protein
MKNLLYILLLTFPCWVWAQDMPRKSKAKAATEEKARELADEDDEGTRPLRKAFADPNRAGTLQIENQRGNVVVEGYAGKEVLIEFTQPNENLKQNLSGYTNQVFTANEANNEVKINALATPVAFRVRVPENTNLQIHLKDGGDVEARQTSGLVEIDNPNGSIKLEGISGWVVANTINGNINASFKSVSAQKTMSFASLNGNITLALPKELQADFRLRSVQPIINDFGEMRPTSDENFPPINNFIQNNAAQYSNINNRLDLNKADKPMQEERKLSEKDAPKGQTITKKKENYKETVNDQRTRAGDTDKLPKQPPPATPINKTRRAYAMPQAYESQSNGGGALIYVQSRNGKITIQKK